MVRISFPQLRSNSHRGNAPGNGKLNLWAVSGAVLWAGFSCTPSAEPPGANPPGANPKDNAVTVSAASPTALGAANLGGDEALAGGKSSLGHAANVELGSLNDNMPFVPKGQKAASTAWRTWIYTDTGSNRTRLGYLRVGAIVDIREPAIKNDGCSGGWVRVNPRGFLCLGKGATTDLSERILEQTSIRPKRGAGNPYLYALATDEPPHFYFQLPSLDQVRRIEGRDPRPRFEQWRLLKVATVPEVAELVGVPEPAPPFLHGSGRLIKPYGVLQRLEERVHSGRAAADSGFAIARVIEHDSRWYGVTTEQDLIALDRVRIAVPSHLRGVVFPEGAKLPIGFVTNEQLARFNYDAQKRLVPAGAIAKRQGVLLTGKSLPGGLMETIDGTWVAAEGLQLVHARKEYPSFATGDRKWIDLSILKQTLVAYRGQTPVFATLVSTGRGGMGDPETEFATPRGTFMIYAKHVSATMDGADDASDSYSLLDVPFVQYFHKGFALHGTYWHDEFGKIRSHGCVNLAAHDAAWLFEWTDPQVSSDWHGVINKERGTVVYIHG